jgi:hypothetical protein
MNDAISQTKAEFVQATNRLARILATTPDDKINWSPSPTARSPLHVAVHALLWVDNICYRVLRGATSHYCFAGKEFPFESREAMHAAGRAMEQEYTTREQVVGLLEAVSARYIAYLDALTPEQLASTVDAIALGYFPMAVAITFPAGHIDGHISQMEYIQTIYGDLDFHMG